MLPQIYLAPALIVTDGVGNFIYASWQHKIVVSACLPEPTGPGHFGVYYLLGNSMLPVCMKVPWPLTHTFADLPFQFCRHLLVSRLADVTFLRWLQLARCGVALWRYCLLQRHFGCLQRFHLNQVAVLVQCHDSLSDAANGSPPVGCSAGGTTCTGCWFCTSACLTSCQLAPQPSTRDS